MHTTDTNADTAEATAAAATDTQATSDRHAFTPITTQEDLDKVLAPENMIQPVRLDIKPLK